METEKRETDHLLSLIRNGEKMTLGQQLRLTAYLSVPAIMAQVSSIAMQYIDASMVGSLGGECRRFHRAGIDHDMALLGIVRSRRDGIFRPSGSPDRSRGFCRSPKDTPPVGRGHACFQFPAGVGRHLHRRRASRMAGR